MAEATQLLRKSYSPFYTQIRTWIRNRKQPGGIQYDGFKYYPRRPDFKDPPYEPSKLFLVKRIKHVWGTNPEERRALEVLNIDGHIKQFGHIAVVKNIPEINKILWKIKHLVTISPIRCPQGLPEKAELGQTYLHENGRLDVTPLLKVSADRAKITKDFVEDPKRISSELLRKHLRYRWMHPLEGTVNSQ